MTEHPNLAAALVAALADLTVVEKGRTAKIPTKDGKSYSYEYADITDVIKVTRPVLTQHGLTVLTPVHAHGNELACTVKIIHSSGEIMDLGPFPFPHGKDAQATGSMVTYHRRYALVAALGMAAGDDDDGAAAAPRQKPAAKPEPAKPEVLDGFLDADDQKTQHDDLAETIKASSPEVREHMKAWRSAQRLDWPMKRDDLERMWHELGEFTAARAQEKTDDPERPFEPPAETHPLAAKAMSVASKARAAS